MGLDFSHTDAHWSYSGFDWFRQALARHEGIDLDQMEGFGGHTPWDSVKTALKPLLNHSDCEGELTPDECREVAPRLRDVVTALWANAPEYDMRGRHAYQDGMALAEGMECAASNGEPLEFC